MMAIDTSGDWAYYGSAIGGAVLAVAGGTIAGAPGTVAGGLIGGYIGGEIGGLFDSPQAGQLNYGEDEMLREWYNKNQSSNINFTTTCGK